MAESRLTQTVVVLQMFNHIFDPEHRVEFSRAPDEPGDVPHRVRLAHATYVELGEPDHITVTVQPGDLLNEGD